MNKGVKLLNCQCTSNMGLCGRMPVFQKTVSIIYPEFLFFNRLSKMSKFVANKLKYVSNLDTKILNYYRNPKKFPIQ